MSCSKTLKEEKSVQKNFILTSNGGGQLQIKFVYGIKPNRRRCDCANGTVILGRVTKGFFRIGNKISITNGSAKVLAEDTIAHLETGRQPTSEIKAGNLGGMLLENNSLKNILYLGIPLYRPHAVKNLRF